VPGPVSRDSLQQQRNRQTTHRPITNITHFCFNMAGMFHWLLIQQCGRRNSLLKLEAGSSIF
jgi:hypothetical protein